MVKWLSRVAKWLSRVVKWLSRVVKWLSRVVKWLSSVGNRRLVPCLFFMFLCQCICDLFGCTWGIYFDCLVNNCD